MTTPTERALTAEDAMHDAILGQNLFHGRYGTTPAGRTTAMAILSGLRDRGYVLADAERAARAEPGLRERLRRVFHDEYAHGHGYLGCQHKNQHQKTWDCAGRADEVMEGLAAISSLGEPQEEM